MNKLQEEHSQRCIETVRDILLWELAAKHGINTMYAPSMVHEAAIVVHLPHFRRVKRYTPPSIVIGGRVDHLMDKLLEFNSNIKQAVVGVHSEPVRVLMIFNRLDGICRMNYFDKSRDPKAEIQEPVVLLTASVQIAVLPQSEFDARAVISDYEAFGKYQHIEDAFQLSKEKGDAAK